MEKSEGEGNNIPRRLIYGIDCEALRNLLICCLPPSTSPPCSGSSNHDMELVGVNIYVGLCRLCNPSGSYCHIPDEASCGWACCDEASVLCRCLLPPHLPPSSSRCSCGEMSSNLCSSLTYNSVAPWLSNPVWSPLLHKCRGFAPAHKSKQQDTCACRQVCNMYSWSLAARVR